MTLALPSRRLLVLPKKDVPANAWRYPDNSPVRQTTGGYWMRS